MKKIIAILAIAATLLTGCAANPEATQACEPAKSGVSPEEVLANFEEILEPINDQFQMTQLQKVPLEDGTCCLPVAVTDTLLGNTYHISIFYTQAGAVDSAAMTADRGAYSNLEFALLSLYLYRSLDLPEMEADAFYEEFNLLTTEPDGLLSTEGWLVSVTTLENILSFVASYNPD